MKARTIILLCVPLLWSCEPVERAPETNITRDEPGCAVSTPDSIEPFVVEPIELIPEALGKFARAITTTSSKAQAFFDQGIQLKYAFAVDAAASSFREAQNLDPNCAMCFWGEAWAVGSYINGHMSEAKAPVALAAIRNAAELAPDHANDVEQALINAMTERYIEDYVYDERRIQDSLFALAMQEVYEAYPDDLDVGTVYAEALFLLEPRGGNRDLNDPDVIRLHDVLEGVLAAEIEHPGACHLYIHATESTTDPGLAASCAAYLGDAIPGASHIQHMPSHTWNEIGSWGKSVRANLEAWHTDQRAEEGTAFAIYPNHNLHMLLYAASYDGQGAIAMQAARDYSKAKGDDTFLSLALTRFGRFDEVLQLTGRPDDIVTGSIWDFCHGYARLKTGEPDLAGVYMRRVHATADTTEAKFRFYEGAPILKVLATILEGEIQWVTGKENAALRTFRKAVALEDDLVYSEPEPFPFAARHWLGAALLEKRRYAEAEKVYRDEIADHPHNGWSLYGLIEALKAQSEPHEAELVDFEESWARADIWLSSSRY